MLARRNGRTACGTQAAGYLQSKSWIKGQDWFLFFFAQLCFYKNLLPSSEFIVLIRTSFKGPVPHQFRITPAGGHLSTPLLHQLLHSNGRLRSRLPIDGDFLLSAEQVQLVLPVATQYRCQNRQRHIIRTKTSCVPIHLHDYWSVLINRLGISLHANKGSCSSSFKSIFIYLTQKPRARPTNMQQWQEKVPFNR